MRYILDRSETEPAPEVDRHHRSPRPRPDPSDPPRPYIVRLLRWSDRQLILRAAAEKGKKLAEKKKRLEWANKPIHVFQDLPPEIQQKRSEYANITRSRSPVWSAISSKTRGHFGWPETYLHYSGTSLKGLDNAPPVYIWIRHWLRYENNALKDKWLFYFYHHYCYFFLIISTLFLMKYDLNSVAT